MRLLILIASFWALVFSKPEMYREKEDFQYSRSSSDDGSRSGFYGAQRGNMGGNYEKAHNMDSLAQHQMSTLVRNVDGELGEGANTRTGSVFSAANSRGFYGSGNFDLSNLKGRHFGEGTSFGDSLSHSSMSQNSGYSGYSGYGSVHSAADNARYGSTQYQNSGYQTADTSLYHQTQDQKIADSTYDTSNYGYNSQAGNNYKYNAQSASQAQSGYDYSNLNSASDYDYKTKSNMLYATPVRVYIRPGTRVAIPVAAQTYDASQSSSVNDQNAVSSDAEILSSSDQRLNYRPTNNAKRYESSYSYRKEWEKHDAVPVTVTPTENPFPKNSELYEDAQLIQAGSKQHESDLSSTNAQSSNVNRAYSTGFSANTKTASASQSQHQTQTYSSGASDINAYSRNAYNAGAATNLLGSHTSDGTANLNNLIEDIGSKPKSYHSSYSYHKSWERRGDPYVIKPIGDISEQTSQRLTAASANHGYPQHYDCNYCTDDSQHRVTRSLHDEYMMNQQSMNRFEQNSGQQTDHRWKNFANLGHQIHNKWDNSEIFNQQPQSQLGNLDDLGQETQNQWGKMEDLGQQTQDQWGKLENLGQQTQDQWGNLENLGQQTQDHWDKLENLGQQPQEQRGKLEDLGQQTQNQWGKFEDLGQQTQNQWGKLENLGQQTQNQWGTFENLGQQTQNQWSQLENLGQQTQEHQGEIEGLGQQTQNQWGELENLGQQTQDQWGNLENLGQQTQDHWDKLENLGQQPQEQQGKLEDLGQQTQNQWGKFEDLGQQTQDQWGKLENLGQQTQNQWGTFENLGQQTQNQRSQLENLDQQTQEHQGEIEDLGQQTQNQWGKLENLGQQTQDQWGNLENLGQQTQDHWNKLENLGQQPQEQQGKLEDLGQQTQNQWGKFEDLGQRTQDQWGKLENLGQQTQIQRGELENLGQQTQNQWGKLENLGQQTQDQWGKLENLGQQPQNQWNKLENLNQQTENQQGKIEDFGQQTQTLDKLDDFGQETHSQWDKLKNVNQEKQTQNEQDLNQQTQNQWDNVRDLGQQTQSQWDKIEDLSQQPQRDKLDNLNQQTQSKWNIMENSDQQSQNKWSKLDLDQQERTLEHQDQSGNFATNFRHVNHITENNHRESQSYKPHTIDSTFIPYYATSQPELQKPIDTTQQEVNDDTNLETHSGNSKESAIEQSKHKQLPKSDRYSQNNTINLINDMKTELAEKTNVEVLQKPSHVGKQPVDIGRGDIGPEDSSVESFNREEKIDLKTPDQTIAFSLPNYINNQNQNTRLHLSVTGLSQQNDKDNSQKDWKDLSMVVESGSTSTTKHKTNQEHQDFSSNKLSTSNIFSLSNDLLLKEKQNDTKLVLPNVPNAHKVDSLEQQHVVQELQNFEHENLNQQLHNFQQYNLRQQSQTFEDQNMGQYSKSYENVGKFEPFKEEIVGQQLEHHEKKHLEDIQTNNQNKVEEAQNFDYQNIQHSDNLEHQNKQLYVNSHDDFGQQVQMPVDENLLQNFKNSEQFGIIPQKKYTKEQNDQYRSQDIEQSLPKKLDLSTPIEPTTEKPGFWGSVWNKTKNAKDSVVSWFHS